MGSTRVTNLEVLDKAQTTSIVAMISKAQLQWTRHVIRMDETRIPRQLPSGELSEGQRQQERPRKRFKDCIEANVQYNGTRPKDFERAATNGEPSPGLPAKPSWEAVANARR